MWLRLGGGGRGKGYTAGKEYQEFGLKHSPAGGSARAYSLYLRRPAIAALPWCFCWVGSGAALHAPRLYPIPCLPRRRHTNQHHAPPTRSEPIEPVEQVYHTRSPRRNKLSGPSSLARGHFPGPRVGLSKGPGGATPPFWDQSTRRKRQSAAVCVLGARWKR